MTGRVGLISANTGIGLSAEQVWADGMPAQTGAVSTALGITPDAINMADSNGVMRQARLIQALGNTPAGYDVIPGWFARADVKVGEWVWCLNRVDVVGEPAIAGTTHKVVASIDTEKLARKMAEVKDKIEFQGVVTPPAAPPARAKPYVKRTVSAVPGKKQGD